MADETIKGALDTGVDIEDEVIIDEMAVINEDVETGDGTGEIETGEGEVETGEEDTEGLNVEQTIEQYGDLMPEGTLNSIVEKFNDGTATGKETISELLNQIGLEKDKANEEMVNNAENCRKNLVEKPIEGVVLKDLSKWVNSQGEEMIELASTLTDFSLGEDAVRSAIKLINKIRMGTSGVGDPIINIVSKEEINRDTLREEYMKVYSTTTGADRVAKMDGIVKKAKKTGDKDLIQWAIEFTR